MTQTQLTNTATGAVIALDDEMYPNDEHNWSAVTESHKYALDGTLIIEQSTRKAGRPYTMQAPDDMAWLPRSTVNALKDERDTLGATFWLDYLADGVLKRVKVIFDNSGGDAVNAKPVRGYISPEPNDPFIVTLKFLEIPSV